VINGADFTSATAVRFDATLADFTVTAANRIIAVVPPEATTGRIRVSNPSGNGTSGSDFVVPPRITFVDPTRSGTNIDMTINGFNFTGTTQVLFSVNRTSVFSVTAPTQIRARVPFGATNGPITVATPAGSASTANAFVVTGPAPGIDSFWPVVGAPGTQVQINGINFTNLRQVVFGTRNATTFSATASSQIHATVPAGATTGKITVSTTGGTAVSTNDFFVTFAPVITNFAPTFGVAGTPVRIDGINFAGYTGVAFNGKPVTGSAMPAPNQIAVTVPVGATTGPITVANSFGVGYSSNDFVVTRAPIISSFEPQLGNPGAPVTISGANLSNGPTVLKFGGVNANFVVTGQNGTQIRATVPNGARTGPLFMTNAFGSFTTSSNFTVPGSAPFIREFAPARGPRGAPVLISGENFTSGAIVKFNGATDPTTAVTALTQIHATVPTNATSGPITVTTSAGTSTNANIFHVPPRLTSFTPTNGIVGSSIVITGANFVAVSDVLFNTGAAQSIIVNASNKLTAVLPTNATTGPLTVTTPGGVIISTGLFRVLPNLTAFSPTLGPVGTPVTINGTSFFNVTNVSFNNRSASFTNVSSTEIRATVPAGATTGPIRVATPDGLAVSATNFIVTTSSDLAVALTASATLLKPGQPLTYTLVVTNKGPSIVTGAAVTNTLPVGVTFVSATSSRGNCTLIGRDVVCPIGNFTNGTGVTIVIEVGAPAEGVLVNTARVRAIESDVNPSDNTASVSTVVVSDASRTLAIRLSPGGSNVVVSWPVSPVSFTLQFLNTLSSSNVWATVPTAPSVVNARQTVTNRADGRRQFYRLQRP
jgi:uncharacterized repeat protein (TIGR01451 family)